MLRRRHLCLGFLVSGPPERGLKCQSDTSAEEQESGNLKTRHRHHNRGPNRPLAPDNENTQRPSLRLQTLPMTVVTVERWRCHRSRSLAGAAAKRQVGQDVRRGFGTFCGRPRPACRASPRRSRGGASEPRAADSPGRRLTLSVPTQESLLRWKGTNITYSCDGLQEHR
ncbi:hypothetical protein AGIG_G6165 [Arapaima gigas]